VSSSYPPSLTRGTATRLNSSTEGPQLSLTKGVAILYWLSRGLKCESPFWSRSKLTSTLPAKAALPAPIRPEVTSVSACIASCRVADNNPATRHRPIYGGRAPSSPDSLAGETCNSATRSMVLWTQWYNNVRWQSKNFKIQSDRYEPSKFDAGRGENANVIYRGCRRVWFSATDDQVLLQRWAGDWTCCLRHRASARPQGCGASTKAGVTTASSIGRLSSVIAWRCSGREGHSPQFPGRPADA
jgi:hypothetical protein